jgi:hypothetical protein
LPEHVNTGLLRSFKGNFFATLVAFVKGTAIVEPIGKDHLSIKQKDTLLDAPVTIFVDSVVMDLS